MENPETEADSLGIVDEGENNGNDISEQHNEDEDDERTEDDIASSQLYSEVGHAHDTESEVVEEGGISKNQEVDIQSVEDVSQFSNAISCTDTLRDIEQEQLVNDKTEDEIDQECIREGQVTGEEEGDMKVVGLEVTEADSCFVSSKGEVGLKQEFNSELESIKNSASGSLEVTEADSGFVTAELDINSCEGHSSERNNVEPSNCSMEVRIERLKEESDCQINNEKDSVNPNIQDPSKGEDVKESSAVQIQVAEVMMEEDECGEEQVIPLSRPQQKKLTHTESVESYEPECDQEDLGVDISGAAGHSTSTFSVLNTSPCKTSNLPPSSSPLIEEEVDVANVVEEQSQVSNHHQNVQSLDQEVENTCSVISKVPYVNSCVQDNSVKSSQKGNHLGDSLGVVHNQEKSGTSASTIKCDTETCLDDDLLSELESELGAESCDQNEPNRTRSISDTTDLSTNNNELPNGMIGVDVKKFNDLQTKLYQMEQEIQRLQRIRQNGEIQFDKVLKERDAYMKENQKLKSHNADDLYLPQIKELEYTITQQQNEIRMTKDKLQSHDTAAKRAVAALQNELKVRVDQVTKMYEDANREKDTMVVKYAQAEKSNLELQKNLERAESKLRDTSKEKETLSQRFKELKSEKKKTTFELDEKNSEIQKLIKELEKQKETISSSDVRVKWAQNKLRAELEGHKETKVELDKMKMKLKDAKEETEQIRRDCQAIVKTYQESEEIKSNALDSQLKVKESELLQQQQAKTDQDEVHQTTIRELEGLKRKHREALSELETLRDKSQCLETERINTEQTLNKFKEMLQKQKTENKELQSKIEDLVQVRTDFKRAQHTIKSLDAEISELKIGNKDVMIEMEACKKRESEKLELTEKLSAKNAALVSENSNLRNQSMNLNGELQSLKMEHQSLETQHKDISEKLSQDLTHFKDENATLSVKLEEKSKAVEHLTVKLEDGKDEIKTLKRKHTNNIKDLTRQLQQVRRKLETYEANGENQKDSVSIGSRTSSNGSLNTVGVSENTSNSVQNSGNHLNNYTYAKQPSPPEQIQEYPVITEQVEPDKQMLIERIVKLQRSLARKNEKIEFTEDHIQQLVDEIQKKNKIIQSYAMREDAGTLTPEQTDINKLQISRKHSIMGSVYSSHQTDSAMTLDLSLEINRKLQAVLEDTLLKNITLKESLDTLGGEISRLSQENRQLQLQIQGKKTKR